MNDKKIIGIDLGATNIRGGLVNGSQLSGINSKRINSSGSVEDVMKDIYAIIDGLKPISKLVLTITGDNGVEFAEHLRTEHTISISKCISTGINLKTYKIITCIFNFNFSNEGAPHNTKTKFSFVSDKYSIILSVIQCHCFA